MSSQNTLLPTEFDLGLKSHFDIEKLIFINSAGFCFTEIGIDKHMVLFGRNNLGKTSTLNAIKLFLLPEVNFNKCEVKFGFLNAKKEAYSRDESFAHYFPQSNSFIILQASSHRKDNKFCIVLHQGSSEYSYHRILVARSFEAISHIFWQATSEPTINHGMGSPVAELSLDFAKKSLIALGGITLNSKETLLENLFQNKPHINPLLSSHSFCLVPFAVSSENKTEFNKLIETWRALVHFSFDISGKNDRILPEVIAQIIKGESSRRRRTNHTVDLQETLNQYAGLKKQQDELAIIEQHLDEWQSLQKDSQALQDWQKTLVEKYDYFRQQLTPQTTQLLQDIQQQQSVTDNLSREKAHLDSQYKQADTSLSDLKGQQKQILKQQANLVASLDKVNNLCQEHQDKGGKTHIIEFLYQQIHKIDETIAFIEQESQRDEKLTAIQSDIKKLQQDIDKFEKNLASVSLLSQLPEHSANVLFNLSKQFAEIGVDDLQLSGQQQQQIDEFTGQFSFDDTHSKLYWLNKLLKTERDGIQRFDITTSKFELANKLETAKAEKKLKETHRDELQRLVNRQSQPQESMSQLRQQKQQLEKQIELLSSHGLLKTQFEESENALAANKEQLAIVQQQVEKLSTTQQQIANDYSVESEKLNQFKKRQADFDNIHTSLKDIYAMHAEIILYWQAHGDGQYGQHRSMITTDTTISYDGVEQLRRQFSDRQLESQIKTYFRKLIAAGILPNTYQYEMHDNFTMTLMHHMMDSVKAKFVNFYDEKSTLNDAITAHNRLVSLKIDEMKSYRESIEHFSQQINEKMGAYQISNLHKVAVVITLNARFNQLLLDLDNIQLNSATALYDEQLHERLNNFCQDYFQGVSQEASQISGQREGINSPVIDIRDLIERVDYQYQINNQDKITSKSQSNGTSMMINCLLLVVLLKRLFTETVEVGMPLVIDEIDALDPQNLKTVCELASNHSAHIFGACPDSSPKILNQIPRFVSLNRFIANRPYHKDRRVLYRGEPEMCITIDETTDTIIIADNVATDSNLTKLPPIA